LEARTGRDPNDPFPANPHHPFIFLSSIFPSLYVFFSMFYAPCFKAAPTFLWMTPYLNMSSLTPQPPSHQPLIYYRLKVKNVLVKSMRKDSLINTNSYLKDSKRREALLAKTIVSSTAIEGVHLDWDELEKPLSVSDKDIRPYVSAKSSGSRR
jgi:hypothetical protein